MPQGPWNHDAHLATALRRAAFENPEIQKFAMPLLNEHRARVAEERDAFVQLQAHKPGLTEVAWARATMPERYAACLKVAHRPIIPGVTKQKANAGEAMMLYMVNPAKNNSKFYEAIIESNDDGTYSVKRRWGGLTDTGQTGRVDGAKFDFDPRFSGLSMGQAKRVLAKYYSAKTGKGYIDAFGPKHKSPGGKKLPSGQYPVGLTRAPGFGWGTQGMAFCIPALRQVQSFLETARTSLQREAFELASAMLDSSADLARTKISRADSAMAKKILDNIKHMQSRALTVLANPEDAKAVRNWKTALARLISYIDKQLSLCSS